jgi:hypothetical protein
MNLTAENSLEVEHRDATTLINIIVALARSEPENMSSESSYEMREAEATDNKDRESAVTLKSPPLSRTEAS